MRQRVCDHSVYAVEFHYFSKESDAAHGPFKVMVLGPKGEPEWVKTAVLAQQHRGAERFHNTVFRSITEMEVSYVVETDMPGSGPRSMFHARLDVTLQERYSSMNETHPTGRYVHEERDLVIVAPRGSVGRAFAEMILERRTTKQQFGLPATAVSKLTEHEIEFSVFVAPAPY